MSDDEHCRKVHDNAHGFGHKHEPATRDGGMLRVFVIEDNAHGKDMCFQLCKHCGALYAPQDEL